MVSDFMLRQRKLLEETKKNGGVPPIKSIYTPDNYKPLVTLPNLNNAPTGGQTTAVNPMSNFDKNANKIELDKTSPITSFIKNTKEIAAYRANLSDPKEAFSATLPEDTTPEDTTSTLNTNLKGIRPEIDPAARHMANMRNDKLGQGDPNYHRVGNMDVTFDDDVSPEARKRFLAPTGRGATFEERGFFGNSGRVPVGWRGMPPEQMRNAGNALPSKEGLNRHQYQQVLENQGKLDVQNARNLSSLASDETAITTQGMRTQGLRDIAKANQGSLQNRAQIKNAQDMKNRESKNLKTQYDIIGTRLKEDLTLSADERLKLQKQQDGIGKLLNSSLQTSGQIAQKKAFEAQAAKY